MARTKHDFKSGDLFSGFRSLQLIPSGFSDQERLAWDRARSRSRKIEAGAISIFVHALVVVVAILMIHQTESLFIDKGSMVFVNNPITLPFGESGDGGGGGGGKNQPMLWATGRLPQSTRLQIMPPDPENPQPLLSSQDHFEPIQSVQIPIDIAQNESLLMGDITAPPNGSIFSGPGDGGGIGPGHGPGIGLGTGPGVGPGSKGGIGGGDKGGDESDFGAGVFAIGNGVKEPIGLYQPLPNYTEDARKARIEGIILLQVIILKNGAVGDVRVLRGLGHGLDESAIRTIVTQWRFKPATLKNRPVDVRANIEVDFRLY
jgi:periplasmic protein TonB